MKWRIDYSRDAEKFLNKHSGIQEKIKAELKKCLKRIYGQPINIDLKKLEGPWAGYYRLRKGKIRIIFLWDTDGRIIYVDKIDFRGDVYKSKNQLTIA